MRVMQRELLRRDLTPAARTTSLNEGTTIALLGILCVGLGAVVTRLATPELLLGAVAVLLVVLWAIARWGALGILLILVTLTPWLPVVSGVYGQPRSYAGIDGSTLRTVGIATLSISALLIARQRVEGGPQPFKSTRVLLLVLAGLGVVSALFTATGGSDFLKLTAQAAGQPLFYAIALTLFVSEARRGPEVRRQLLRALCISLIGEALICVVQVADGAAYDPVRNITRAQGTLGADALGAFAMIGVFMALALRSCAERRRDRILGAAGVVAGLAMLVLALARGPAIAFAVALLITALPRRGQVNARRVSTLLLVALLAAIALYASKGLWLARLDAPSTGGFDRPATWVAGLRLVRNHPLVGVGSTHAVQVITSSSEYSQTQFGDTGDLPHNAWLYAAAANGALYGIVLVVLTVLFVVELVHCKGPPETRYLKAGLVGLALVFFENNLFNHPEIMLVVLLAAAIIAASVDPRPDRPADAAFGLGHTAGWATATGATTTRPGSPAGRSS
jgi:O-antigen ligase/polysaccharide polymerase Wzy-like membrane protein